MKPRTVPAELGCSAPVLGAGSGAGRAGAVERPVRMASQREKGARASRARRTARRSGPRFPIERKRAYCMVILRDSKRVRQIVAVSADRRDSKIERIGAR